MAHDAQDQPDPPVPSTLEPAGRRDQAATSIDDLQRLWAPWRAGYLRGEDPVEGCPFCVLPERGDDEANLILARGEHAYVICNAYPYNPGHVMAVPYQHTDDLTALAPEVAAELWELGRTAVGVLRERLHAAGVNLGMNLWRAGGAGIADHVHLHAVPRWGGDTNFVSVVGATRILPQSLDEVYAALRPGFDAA